MTDDLERAWVIVFNRLGSSTAKLYLRLAELEPAVPVMRSVILNLLCGAYHDYRSDSILPKGDLVNMLRHANGHTSEARWKLEELIAELVRGDFDEDDREAQRWADRMLRERTRPVPIAVVKAIAPSITKELTSQQVTALRWLVDYVEKNARPPTIVEVATGLNVSRDTGYRLLCELQKANAVTKIGGARGWIPTKTA